MEEVIKKILLYITVLQDGQFAALEDKNVLKPILMIFQPSKIVYLAHFDRIKKQ